LQDPMKGIYDLLEILNEKFPGMGLLSRNGKKLPPVIQIDHVYTRTVEELIKPICAKIEKEYDFGLRIEYDEKDSLRCCIYVIDRLNFLAMYIEENLNNITQVDTHYAEVQMRKDLYPNVVQEI